MRKYCKEIESDDCETAEVSGWIHEIRNLGGIAFILLRDKTGILQLTFLKKENKELFKRVTALPRESVVTASGAVQRNEKIRNGFEILPNTVIVHSKAAVPLPLGVSDKVESELDTRLDNRFLDLRKEKIRHIFQLRAVLLESARKTLGNHDFLETHTPKIVASATEGGTELFPIKYFKRDAYLNQSPQLYKQMLMASGFDKVYEIGPAFRAEEHDTVRHLNEFSSMDIEMAFSNHNQVMELLEEVITNGYDSIRKNSSELMESQHLKIPEKVERFPKLSYTKAVDIASSQGLDISWGDDLSMEATRIIAKDYPDFYFITDWPDSIKPFYAQPENAEENLITSEPTKVNEEHLTCRSFDLMYREKELTSGAQRVHDYELLKKRITERGLNPENFEFYLSAFKFGMPPHAGWGLGVERWVMTVTGLENIRETVLFPRDMYRLVP